MVLCVVVVACHFLCIMVVRVEFEVLRDVVMTVGYWTILSDLGAGLKLPLY